MKRDVIYIALALLLLPVFAFGVTKVLVDTDSFQALTGKNVNGRHNVLFYGAKCDGTTDDSGAFAAAISTAGANSTIEIPPGTCKLVTGITISSNRVHLVGSGRNSTILQFAPVANGTLISVANGASIVFQGSIRDLSLYSTDSTNTKVGIEIQDGSEYLVDNVSIGGSVSGQYWSGASSVGLRIKGREAGTIRKLTSFADLPLVIADNPNSTLDIDQYHFVDTYLSANGNPNITINTGVNLSNVTFDGYQAWVGGTHGLHWLDTTSSIVSNTLTIRNVRTEQGTSATSYSFFINHNTNLQNLIIENAYLESGRRGINLKKVVWGNLNNVNYLGTGIALDVDSTVRPLELRNAFFQSGSTVTATGLTKIFDSGQSSIGGTTSPFVIYDINSDASNIASVSKLRYTAVAFASLPASPDGTQIYCNDCTFANPCAGAGSGAMAKRLNGAWRCD